jgi:hypothetical protein
MVGRFGQVVTEMNGTGSRKALTKQAQSSGRDDRSCPLP